MTAHDNLSPQQFSYDKNIHGYVTARGPGVEETVRTQGMGLTQLRHAEDMPNALYHGTSRDIQGDQIEPGHPGNFVKRMSHVYMTESQEEARNYAGPEG